MYFKKMLMVIFAFILTLITFSLLCFLFFSLNGSGVNPNDFLKLPLYIIGYGESPNLGSVIQLTLCIAGLIMINFLNAYLTVALFRLKRVEIKPGISKRADQGYTILFDVANKGRDIFNVSLTLQVYEENEAGDICDLGCKVFTRKYIGPKKNWRIQHMLETGDMLFNFFRSHSRESGGIRLQGILEYLDNDTGNQIVIAKEFSFRDFEAPHGLKRGTGGKENLDSELKRFLSTYFRTVDLLRAKPVTENGDAGAVRITASPRDKQMIEISMNFKKKENRNPPQFMMALLPGEDWSGYFRVGYSLAFDICSTEQVKAVTLELKTHDHIKIIDQRLSTQQNFKHYSLKLNDYSANADDWAGIREICFTCFAQDVDGETGTFKIKNLRLAR